jgi:hypothetical protein
VGTAVARSSSVQQMTLLLSKGQEIRRAMIPVKVIFPLIVVNSCILPALFIALLAQPC